MNRTERNINIIQYHDGSVAGNASISTLTLLEDNYWRVTNFIDTYVMTMPSFISRWWRLNTQSSVIRVPQHEYTKMTASTHSLATQAIFLFISPETVMTVGFND